MEMTGSSVVRARVVHSRRTPVNNSFAYEVDYLMLDEAALIRNEGPRLFSYGRPNLVCLRKSDHGAAGYENIHAVLGLVKKAGVSGADRALLLTHPRYWGYTFNPVSFWLVFSSAGNLRTVLAEVHNTFGDRHAYLCTAKNGADIRSDSWTDSSKRFHVSPFFDITGKYRFRFLVEEARIAIRIDYDDGAGGGLSTALSGSRRPFTDRELARALLRHPLGAAKTTALIHWQALRLWRKGVRYRNRPEPPERGITT